MTYIRSPFVVSSPYNTLSLEIALVRMAMHPNVSGIVLIGSTAHADSHRSHSDNDILIVMSEPPPVHVAVTMIDHRLTDLTFTDEATIKMIAESEQPFELDSWESRLSFWLKTGKIALDVREGLLRKTQRLLQSRQDKVTVNQARIYVAWFSINYDLRQNQRMLEIKDPLYQMAVDLRLLFSIFDLITAYFTIRKLPWRGEKSAARYWQDNDPEFYDLVQAAMSTVDREEKFDLYCQLAERTVEPVGGLWHLDVTAVQPATGQLDVESIDAGLQLIEDLLRGKS